MEGKSRELLTVELMRKAEKCPLRSVLLLQFRKIGLVQAGQSAANLQMTKRRRGLVTPH